MAKAKSKKKSASVNQPQQTRLWLMYPAKLITRPIIWEISQKFPVITNVRQVSVTDEIGIVSLELNEKAISEENRKGSIIKETTSKPLRAFLSLA